MSHERRSARVSVLTCGLGLPLSTTCPRRLSAQIRSLAQQTATSTMTCSSREPTLQDSLPLRCQFRPLGRRLLEHLWQPLLRLLRAWDHLSLVQLASRSPTGLLSRKSSTTELSAVLLRRSNNLAKADQLRLATWLTAWPILTNVFGSSDSAIPIAAGRNRPFSEYFLCTFATPVTT